LTLAAQTKCHGLQLDKLAALVAASVILGDLTFAGLPKIFSILDADTLSAVFSSTTVAIHDEIGYTSLMWLKANWKFIEQQTL
jgi:hypothetical protein